jgi:hypothetical protein
MSMRNRQGPFPAFVNEYLGAAFAVSWEKPRGGKRVERVRKQKRSGVGTAVTRVRGLLIEKYPVGNVSERENENSELVKFRSCTSHQYHPHVREGSPTLSTVRNGWREHVDFQAFHADPCRPQRCIHLEDQH